MSVCQDYMSYGWQRPLTGDFWSSWRNHLSIDYFFCHEKALVLLSSTDITTHYSPPYTSLPLPWSLTDRKSSGLFTSHEIDWMHACLFRIHNLLAFVSSNPGFETMNIYLIQRATVRQERCGILATNDRILRPNSSWQSSTDLKKFFFFSFNG